MNKFFSSFTCHGRMLLLASLGMLLCCNTSCKKDGDPITDEERPIDNPGGSGSGGQDNPSGGGSGSGGSDTGGGSSQPDNSRLNIFNQCFDAPGHVYWSREDIYSSTPTYGSINPKKETKVHCILWEVESVKDGVAHVVEYQDFDFENKIWEADFHTNESNQLIWGKNSVLTNTTKPDFIYGNIPNTSFCECSETYDDNTYINSYYTTSNGYTAIDWVEVKEMWSKFALSNAYYKYIGQDAIIVEKQRKIVALKNNYSDLLDEKNPLVWQKTPEITGISGWISSDGRASVTLSFTHVASQSNTWAYEVTIPGDDGEFHRISEFTDGDDYFSYYRVKEVDPSTSTSKSISFILQPQTVEMAFRDGYMAFGISALGFGREEHSAEYAGLTFTRGASVMKSTSKAAKPVRLQLKAGYDARVKCNRQPK